MHVMTTSTTALIQSSPARPSHILHLPDDLLVAILLPLHLPPSIPTASPSTPITRATLSSSLLPLVHVCTAFERVVSFILRDCHRSAALDLLHPAVPDTPPQLFWDPSHSFLLQTFTVARYLPPSLRSIRLPPCLPAPLLRALVATASSQCTQLRELVCADAGALQEAQAVLLLGPGAPPLLDLCVSDPRDAFLSALAAPSSSNPLRLSLPRIHVAQLSTLAAALPTGRIRFLAITIHFGDVPTRSMSFDARMSLRTKVDSFGALAARELSTSSPPHGNIWSLSIAPVSWGSLEACAMRWLVDAFEVTGGSGALVEVQSSPSELDVPMKPREDDDAIYQSLQQADPGGGMHLTSRMDLAGLLRGIYLRGESAMRDELKNVTTLYDHGKLRGLHCALFDAPEDGGGAFGGVGLGGGDERSAALRRLLTAARPKRVEVCFSLAGADCRRGPRDAVSGAAEWEGMNAVRNLAFVLRFVGDLETLAIPSDWLAFVGHPAFRPNLLEWRGVRSIALTATQARSDGAFHSMDVLISRGALRKFISMVSELCPVLQVLYMERAPWDYDDEFGDVPGSGRGEGEVVNKVAVEGGEVDKIKEIAQENTHIEMETVFSQLQLTDRF